MRDQRIDRLISIEANAWRSYQDARRKAAERRTASRTQAVIDEGQRWQDRNADLHGLLETFGYRDVADYLKRLDQ